MKTVFLHGLGQDAQVWEPVLACLPEVDAVCPSLYMLPEGSYTWENLRRSVTEMLNGFPGPLQLCGLSLGAVLALEYAAAYPDRVSALILSAPQTDPPAWLMKVQGILFRCMPEKTFDSIGLSKGDCIRLMTSMTALELTDKLPGISCPTLVLCGERDRANRKAAETVAGQIPDALLRIVPGAGHEMNRQIPERLAAEMKPYIEK